MAGLHYLINTCLYFRFPALPSSKPELSRIKEKYTVGDFVNVSCAALRSRPASNLTWYINNRPVSARIS